MQKRSPKDMERALRALAGSQSGYFTAAQARAVGYDYPQQHFHRSRGNWEQVDRGVFRFPDYPASPHEHLVRWALWSRDRRGSIQAVVSHETALSVYDISDAMPASVHLTVPQAFRKRPPGGCVLHRAVIAPAEVVWREGFAITSPLRALRDVAESATGARHLETAVRDALAQGLVTRDQLLEARLTAPGRERILTALVKIGGGAS